jgi:hypothetical protein
VTEPTPTDRARSHQRSPRNYLLAPMVQVRLGLYAVVLGFLFAAGTLGVLYAGLSRAYVLILPLIEEREKQAVRAIVEAQFKDMAVYIAIIAATFMIGTTVVSILYTHRMVGPTYAFRRHLKSLLEGRYEVRTFLRKHDAFTEVANDLNALADHLQRGATAVEKDA